MFKLAAMQFVFVFLKAFQQRNVAYDNYMAVLPFSLMMAFAEFYVILEVVKSGWDVWLLIGVGLGAALGAMCAMFLHKKYFMKGKESAHDTVT